VTACPVFLPSCLTVELSGLWLGVRVRVRDSYRVRVMVMVMVRVG
jgi:hypothetical protein